MNQQIIDNVIKYLMSQKTDMTVENMINVVTALQDSIKPDEVAAKKPEVVKPKEKGKK